MNEKDSSSMDSTIGASEKGLYTIGSAAAELGMPASTIRFYEKNGLIPNQRRSSDGRRLFDEDDLEWMRFVERLKVSGMPSPARLLRAT